MDYTVHTNIQTTHSHGPTNNYIYLTQKEVCVFFFVAFQLNRERKTTNYIRIEWKMTLMWSDNREGQRQRATEKRKKTYFSVFYCLRNLFKLAFTHAHSITIILINKETKKKVRKGEILSCACKCVSVCLHLYQLVNETGRQAGRPTHQFFTIIQ